ncbi:uncharacterized protein LOC119572530, partial [Penaeus monodon]|uniref:uncharacterized protein LOC119572530 n=1 Tax=Penaeus monodon TaxID=6687 RepID=UPI0018A7A5F0
MLPSIAGKSGLITLHCILAPCRTPDVAGYHIANSLETFPEITLLNSQESCDNRSGAGFVARDTTQSLRVTDNAFSLQAEAVAITGALVHASLRERHITQTIDHENWCCMHCGETIVCYVKFSTKNVQRDNFIDNPGPRASLLIGRRGGGLAIDVGAFRRCTPREMQAENQAGWKTPRLSDRKSRGQKMDHAFPIAAEGKSRVPSAFVRPFPPGEDDFAMERESAVPAFVHKHQSSSPHFPSPHLLGLQSGTTVTPVKGLARSPRTGSPIPSLGHTPHASPSSRDLELHSLRNQVQEIQDKLNGDIISSTEYQQLFYEKVKLEEMLGATEHELQQLQTAYNDLETNAALTERNLNSELRDMKEKYQAKAEKHKATLEELTRLTDYLRDLPTLDEHHQLQQQLARKSAQSTHLSRKIDHLTQKLAELAARESEQEARIEVLSQEKEDLALKLGLTEKILKDLESEQEARIEVLSQEKEDLALKLGLTEKILKDLES